jgi:methyltransferase (TIGR00027 family)
MHSTQKNIVQSGIPSRSALRVAKLRAAHQLLDVPVVFVDPFALPILGPETEAAVRADPFQFNEPFSRGMRASVIVRSLLAEDKLAGAVQAGIKQYVVLGAGLDTFAFRNPYAGSGLKVYEVDHASTQEWKKTLITGAGIDIPPSMHFVPVDFENDSLADELEKAGFDAGRPACLSWLGVTLYLTKEAVFETLRYVASMPKGSSIVFDYGILRSQLHPIERFLGEYVAQSFAAQGEPWKTFFDPDDLREELRKMGFSAMEDVGPNELNARYLFRRKDGLQAAGGARLMCAAV